METHFNIPILAGQEPDPVTERVRATWTAGDFGRIAAGYERGAAEFIARLGLDTGERVLDVACGTGNLAIPAARTGASVTGIDIAPNLISQARARATTERQSITFDVGDAECMPYAIRSFDTLVTMFGAMFAARQERAASELLRVTRHGGRIAMANWTPTGFIGEVFKATTRYVPPAAGSSSPLLWGTEEHVRSLLGEACVSLTCKLRLMTFEYPFGPVDVVSLFRKWYGPTVRAFAALSPAAQEELHRDLVALWFAHNRATDGTTRVESEYLEVVGIVA